MQLASELSRPYVEQRRIQRMLVANETIDDLNNKKRRQCRLEIECKGNKTADTCFKCQRPACGKCSAESRVVKDLTCIDCKV